MKKQTKKAVKIVEVGLRDGLQNESTILSVKQRFELFNRLVEAGSRHIEFGAFVSPRWVKQMADTSELAALIQKRLRQTGKHGKQKPISTSVLVPNEAGMLRAIAANVNEVAIFGACSESFSKKNINCTISESFARFAPVMKLARQNNIKVRGYLSVCFGCPFEGAVSESKVVTLAQKMWELGVYEISIGDTIGVAHAGQVQSLFSKLEKVIPLSKLAGHFHDTRGQALANILAAYQLGVRVFDSSIAGLGGCPYAPGATGNVATEDVVYMFDGMKVKTNLQIEKLIEIHRWLQPLMDHPLASRVGRVGLLK